jgi:hypothetical protein
MFQFFGLEQSLAEIVTSVVFNKGSHLKASWMFFFLDIGHSSFNYTLFMSSKSQNLASLFVI